MCKLSIKKYTGLCVLGGEVTYLACMLYGTTLSGPSAQLHHAIFALMPGFTWLTWGSVFMGAVTVALWSAIAGAFIAWMHNVSLEKQ